MFSEKIKTLRTAKGLSQGQLASLLFVSQQAVSRWETGLSYPDIPTLKAISAYFGVSLDELVGQDEYSSAKDEKKVRHSPLLYVGIWECICYLSCLAILLVFRFALHFDAGGLLEIFTFAAVILMIAIMGPVLGESYRRGSGKGILFGLVSSFFFSAFALGAFVALLHEEGPNNPALWVIFLMFLLSLSTAAYFLYLEIRSGKGALPQPSPTTNEEQAQKIDKVTLIMSSLFVSLTFACSIPFALFYHQLKWAADLRNILLFTLFGFCFLSNLMAALSELITLFTLRLTRKKKVTAPLVLVMILALSFFASLTSALVDNHNYDVTYSYTREKWLSATPDERYRIWPYFEKDHDLKGQSKDEVIYCLGNPYTPTSEEDWRYSLGHDDTLFQNPTDLWINFSSEGTVTSYILYSD